MARILKQEIKDQILNDNQLAAAFCDAIKCKIISLPGLLSNDRKVITHVDAITWLCKRLGKTQDQILTEANTPVSA